MRIRWMAMTGCAVLLLAATCEANGGRGYRGGGGGGGGSWRASFSFGGPAWGAYPAYRPYYAAPYYPPPVYYYPAPVVAAPVAVAPAPAAMIVPAPVMVAPLPVVAPSFSFSVGGRR